MQCTKCKIKPGFHSFDYITDISGVRYFYSFPAQNKESVRTREDMLNYVSHLPTDRKWSLLFHMSGYGFSHMMPVHVAYEMVQIILKNYKDNLHKIYIIEGQWFMNFLYLTFPFLSKEIREKFVSVEGSQLEIIGELRKTGLSYKQLEPLHKNFGKIEV